MVKEERVWKKKELVEDQLVLRECWCGDSVGRRVLVQEESVVAEKVGAGRLLVREDCGGASRLLVEEETAGAEKVGAGRVLVTGCVRECWCRKSL